MINTVCYLIGWLWCILWGIYGHPLVALLGAIFLIALQLHYSRFFWSDVLLVAISIPVGFLIEFLLIQTQTIRYGNSSFPPIWIIPIYPLFALLINHLFSFLKDHAIAGFCIGFFGIPSTYFWLERHGGLSFGYSPILTWIIIGTAWGLLFSLLLKVSATSHKRT